MGWKATGQPTVRKQRDKWVVRVDGIDTETGNHRPRQLGTYGSQRVGAGRRPVRLGPGAGRHVVTRWVGWSAATSRRGTDVTLKAREQYQWAIPHIEAGLGAIRLDRLDREDVAVWLDGLAAAGDLSWRSIQICRTVLRAALADAVEEGLLRRSPAARVPMPRTVAKPPKVEGGRGLDRRAGGPVPGRSAPITAGPSRSASACSTACAGPRPWR